MDFAFRKRTERIDWRKITAADVDNITRMLDFDALQENIVNIAFCDIEQELDMQYADPNYVKLFQLSQLTLEYLLHSQEYLINKLQDTQSMLSSATEELSKFKCASEACQAQLTSVKAESHKRKKIIAAQQLVLQNGKDAYNKCPHCVKAFISNTFLEAHISKRHQNCITVTSVKVSAEPQLVPVKVTETQTAELDRVKRHLQETEERLAKEIEMRSKAEDKLQARAAQVERELRKEMETLEKVLHAEHQKNTECYLRQLAETNEKLRIAEEVLQKKMGSYIDLPQNNFEMIELRRQREEIALLKEELMAQINQQKNVPKKVAELSKQKAVLISQQQQHRNQRVQKPASAASSHASNVKLDSFYEEKKTDSVAIKMSATNERLSASAIGEEFSDGELESLDESTTNGTRMLPTYDSTLSLTDNTARLEQLQNKLKMNPELIRSARQEVTQELESALEKRGIDQATAGISNELYAALAASLKTERTKLAKDVKNFYDLRNQVVNKVEAQAKAQHSSTLVNAAATPHGRNSALPSQRSLTSADDHGWQTANPQHHQATNTANSLTLTGTSVSHSGSSLATGRDGVSEMIDTEGQSKPEPEKRTGARKQTADIDSQADDSDWDSLSEMLNDDEKPIGQRPVGSVNQPQSANRTNIISLQSPQTKTLDNDLSLKSISSIEEAAAPSAASAPRCSGEPTLNVNFQKGKKLRSSVTFSDEFD